MATMEVHHSLFRIVSVIALASLHIPVIKCQTLPQNDERNTTTVLSEEPETTHASPNASNTFYQEDMGGETSSVGSHATKIPLYLGGLFSFGGLWNGGGILLAVQMGLDHINAREDILTDYEIKMVWNDTECYAGRANRMFIEQLIHKPTKILLLGPPCSVDAQVVAETAHYWNLITFSYSAGSPALSNRNMYPFFYRSITTELSFNPGIIALMRKFGWTRIATIHENHELFSLAIEDFSKLIQEANFTMVTSETVAEDAHVAVANVEQRDAKIIFLSMYSNLARKIFCEAYKRGMMHSGYVWIYYNWYNPNWWTKSNDEIECTVEEMDEIMVSSTILAISRSYYDTSGRRTVSGWTTQELKTQLRARFEWPENSAYEYISFGSFGYDAAWAIALMLNKSVEILKNKVFADGEKRRLEDFNYQDSEMAQLFLDLFNETSFYGMSGYIAFKDGDRIGDTDIYQQGHSGRLVANYKLLSNSLEWVEEIAWKDGYVPIDHTATIHLYRGIAQLSLWTVCIFAGVGTSMAVFFLGFNIRYRMQRTVKMSSPNMNNLIIIGSIWIYISVILGGLDRNLIDAEMIGLVCQLRAWFLSTGFVLTFGSMFSKTWRVYRVAALKTPKRVVVTDNHLFVMVSIFFCIDVVILTLWQIVDPMYTETINLDEIKDSTEIDQRVITYTEQCRSDFYLIWLLSLYGYKGLLLVFGAFLAWETRKVTIPALNDSKLIGICVYNTVVLCIVGVAVSFLISDDTAASFIFTSCIIIFCATLTLVVLFVPKIISVVRYPDGEPNNTVKGSARSLNRSSTNNSVSNGSVADERNIHTKVNQLEESRNNASLSDMTDYGSCGVWCGHVAWGCCAVKLNRNKDSYDVNHETRGMSNPAMSTESSTI